MKKHDFIEIEYTGRLEDGKVFDTTDEKTAKEAGLDTQNARLGPVVVCLGEHHILKGLEEEIIGKKPGEYNIALPPDKAFGKKDAKLLRLIPAKLFRKEKLTPFPGLEVNIDNMYGIVRTVSGGRVIVDFNHPLSGRVVKYAVKVSRVVEDPLEKAKAVFRNELGMPDAKLTLVKDALEINEKIPEELLEGIRKRVLDLIKEIKSVELKKEAP